MILEKLNKRYDIQARVRRGVEFMDEINPNWRDYVKPHLLDMEALDWCVGALYMKYSSGYVFADYKDFKIGYMKYHENPARLGFEAPSNNRIIGRLQYWLLTKEWRKLIERDTKNNV